MLLSNIHLYIARIECPTGFFLLFVVLLNALGVCVCMRYNNMSAVVHEKKY